MTHEIQTQTKMHCENCQRIFFCWSGLSPCVKRLKHEQKLSELRAASAALAPRRETEFAAIDEAIATHRAAQPFDPDHGYIGNHEADAAYEIRLLRSEVSRLAKENENLKIKLSRMCCDA